MELKKKQKSEEILINAIICHSVSQFPHFPYFAAIAARPTATSNASTSETSRLRNAASCQNGKRRRIANWFAQKCSQKVIVSKINLSSLAFSWFFQFYFPHTDGKNIARGCATIDSKNKQSYCESSFNDLKDVKCYFCESNLCNGSDKSAVKHLALAFAVMFVLLF